MNEEKIKAIADAMWDQIITFKATQESITEAIREAYRVGKQDALDWKKPRG